MKIAMFADSYRPTVDGAVVAMETTCAGLERNGHEVVVLAPDVRPRPSAARTVHYLPSVEFKKYPGYRVAVSPSDMLEFLRKERVDIIHSHGLASMAILSLAASRALKIPHLLTFHTMAHEAMNHYSPLPMRQEFVNLLVWGYLRNLLKRPEVVIAPSRPVKEELLANGARMKACEVVPTGVDCSRFSPERYDRNFLTRFGLGGKRVMLHVGRLSKEKKLDIVLKAVAELAPSQPDIALLVIGTGPAEAYYRAEARRLGIENRVVFTGFLTDADLPVAYASCEALVIASTFETQGLVVLEALASGIPVAGIRFRAVPEFIEDGKNGCLFDLDNCADAIRRCLAKRDSLVLNTVSSARRYSIDSCTARLEDAYRMAAEIAARNS